MARAPREERSMRPDEPILITIDEGQNRPVCDPYYARYRKGARLQWTFPGFWTIHFLDKRTPVQDADGMDRFDISGKDDRTFDAPVAQKTGHYRYAVAAILDEDARQQRIYIDATCPEVVIGE